MSRMVFVVEAGATQRVDIAFGHLRRGEVQLLCEFQHGSLCRRHLHTPPVAVERDCLCLLGFPRRTNAPACAAPQKWQPFRPETATLIMSARRDPRDDAFPSSCDASSPWPPRPWGGGSAPSSLVGRCCEATLVGLPHRGRREYLRRRPPRCAESTSSVFRASTLRPFRELACLSTDPSLGLSPARRTRILHPSPRRTCQPAQSIFPCAADEKDGRRVALSSPLVGG